MQRNDVVDEVTDDMFAGEDDGTRPRVEPSASQRSAALSLYGLYVALGDVGFSEDQALSVVAKMAAAAVTVED